MTVRIEKPSINVREKLAELDKPTGIAGEAMLRAETPQEQQALIGVGRRNIIINGAMQVWQRGTSFTGYNNYSADRWRVSVSAVPITNTIDLVQEGNKNYARWQCTMGSGQLAFFHQRVEGNPLAGKTVTVSFSAKGTGTLSEISLVQITGGVSSQVIAATNVVLSATESRYSFTVDLPSIASVPLSTDQTRVQFFCAGSTSSVDLYLTEVQLELGKVATPFEHRSYGEELALCQRYYERFAEGRCDYGQIYGVAGNVVQSGRFGIEKRTTPTITSAGTPTTSGSTFSNGYNLGSIVGTSSSSSKSYSIIWGASSSGWTPGLVTTLSFSSSSYLEFDAEL